MESFSLIAFTPAGLDDPAIAIAASRSGEIGVLDLGHSKDLDAAMAALKTLARFASRGVGVRVSDRASVAPGEILSRLPESVDLVVLAVDEPQGLAETIRQLAASGRRVLLEVTDVRRARAGVDLGVAGWIAKGHESGGWVGEETAFVLLQRLLAEGSLPVWVRGGIGIHTAAACAAAGAAGVVLDAQLLLTRESGVGDAVRRAVRAMDGSETICLGGELETPVRVYARTGGSESIDAIGRLASELSDGDDARAARARFRSSVEARIGWSPSDLWPIGQDAAFAASLADTHGTVAGVLAGLRAGIDAHLRAASEAEPLSENGPLASSHRTRYPVVQGPMTRVSDRSEFALKVAEGGGLPFLALALMRAPEVERLLAETSEKLGDRSWGVGILGFVPLELRQEQLEVIRKYRPPFALIAGGRPDQARGLEKDGTASYLHVPSPGLLDLFLKDGARRFVFEGRECGGHVGPRSSFVLWNTMIDRLLDSLPAGQESDCHVLFAGGIHGAVSGAMVAAMAAPLAERGVKVGVLLGTAYLFTHEAVESGAIVRGFQEEALRCDRTVTLETGPGHSTRCADTPFARVFRDEKRNLVRAGRSPEEIRNALEMLNLGRLRIASKGMDRDASSEERRYVEIRDETQRAQGMYMIGQVAALRTSTCGVEDLHREVSVSATELLAKQRGVSHVVLRAEPEERPSAVAIVGLSCILPKAPDAATYWDNILSKVDAITEIPKDRWDWELYFDPDPRAKDKIYSKWGGFLDDQTFDPVEFGMPPNSLKSVDPMQLLALKAARRAMEDAGYWKRPFDRSRTSVILGASGGTGDLGAGYLLRSSLPLVLGDAAGEVIERSNGLLPEWTEDSFAGLLLNVAAGRIANRFDFGGLNYVVDAACASSLAAVHHAVRELEAHTTDLVLVGGVDTTQNPFGYLCFSKTHALSPTGKPRTFDAAADGIAIAEGIVMLVLKRLEDAERDGDRVYAVIRGTAGSSDGRAKGMTAPRPEGQMSALRRAYRKAGMSPTTVGLFEAHGTGTVVGDRTEALALTTVLEEAGAGPQSAAVGSVKSMIGHTKATAGVASLAKVALALYHKVLPPTLGVTDPNPNARLSGGPLYVNSETRPWIQGNGTPRRAGASSFGFGGTNFHAVVEEYTSDFMPARAAARRWPSELVLLTGASREDLVARIDRLRGLTRGELGHSLLDLAFTAWAESDKAKGAPGAHRLAVVAGSVEDLSAKLQTARDAIDGGAQRLSDARGVFFESEPLGSDGSVAFLFPGQGSQYPNMLRDLAVHFPEVRSRFEEADRALEGVYDRPLSRFVFPPPAFRDDDVRTQQREITETNVAQPALGAADAALAGLLAACGVRPAMVAGHSYGEYVALGVAGAYDFATLARVSEARGRSIIDAAREDLGTMAAVDASADEVRSLVASLDEVWLSNVNAPRQSILSGSRRGIEAALARAGEAGLRARPLPVACAFHSPIVAPARERLASFLDGIEMCTPRIPVYSNVTAARYPEEPEAIRTLLAEHLEKPVLFADQIRAMHDAGARLFVEVGPRNVLSGLTDQTLEGLPHASVAMDLPGRSGLTQLQHGLAALAAHGIGVDLARLFEGRGAAVVDATPRRSLTPTTWLVNGSRVRPASEEPRRKGHAPVRVVLPDATASGNGSHTPSTSTAPADPGTSRASRPVETPPAPAPSAVSHGPDAARAMVEFQGLMSRFLETQRSVMSAYLGSGATVAPSPEKSAPADAVDASPAAVEGPPAVVEPEVEPEPEPRPQAERAPEPAGVASREELESKLLEIVSDRTGYPADMLGLDVDIEAELGIDSIKRVEILGTVQSACLPESASVAEGAMEELNRIKTLRGIVDWLERAVQGPGGDVPPESPEPAGKGAPVPEASEPPRRVAISRATVELVDAPLGKNMPTRLEAAKGGLLVTDDGGGVGRALVDLLRERGVRAALVEGGRVSTDEASAASVLSELRGDAGAVSGIVHLEPLGAKESALREELARDVRGFFYLAKAAGPEIETSLRETGSAWSVAAFPVRRGDERGLSAVHPTHAALRGMAKTLALEWPGVRCASIELELGAESTRRLAERIAAELIAGPGEAVEVIYDGGTRKSRAPRLRPAGGGDGTALRLGPESVVLLTGGARGITAEIAVDLAERHRPKLVLWGRTPEPAAEEAEATRGLTAPSEIKSALIAEAEARGEDRSLPAIEARYRALSKEREMRATFARIRAAGSSVHYQNVDMRRDAEVDGALRECRERFGRIDVVVHGAGIIEDKLVAQKSAESFDRVFDTKVEGALSLAEKLRRDEVEAFVLFTSAAGTFGNRGQFDYAGANEALTELADQLNGAWQGRVVSMAWGPWEKTGMVSDELRREFEKRGIDLIPLREGCRLFYEELRSGSASEARVVFAGGSWSGAQSAGSPERPDGATPGLPLLRDAVLANGGHVVRARRFLDPAKDLYLTDHRIDGAEVLPMAVATEMMAEVAQQAWPEMTVIGVRELQLLRGVVLEGGSREIEIVARPQVEASHDRLGVDVHVEIHDPETEGKPHYRATIELADRPVEPPRYETPNVSGLPSFEPGVRDAYRQWLFHGPLLQGISHIHGLGRDGVEATLVPSPPERCLRGGAGEWLIDPVVLDSGLQLFLLWARANVDKTPLPSRFTRLRRYAPIGREPVRCFLRILESSRDPVFHIDIHFVGADGRLLWSLEQMEGACTKALNRLGGSWLEQAAGVELASRAAGS